MSTDKTEIVYGKHAVRHCLQHSPEAVLEIWVQENKRASKAFREILALTGDVSIQTASQTTLDKLSQYGRHQGIALRRKYLQATATDLDSLLAGTETHKFLFLVLDGVQDPHNLGACLRTADAAGVDAVILPKDRAVAVTAVVSKVASGAAETVPVIYASNLARSLRQLQAAGVWILGTADEADGSLFDMDLNRPLAIVMGAEGQGLRHNTREHCDMLAKLPMAGQVESLNVSVAAGVCLYEAVRQRL